MSNFKYTEYGSKDSASIIYAPESMQRLWRLGSFLGLNIIRLRKHKRRFGIQRGDTYLMFHLGKLSLFRQRNRPKKPLYNKSSMQTLDCKYRPTWFVKTTS